MTIGEESHLLLDGVDAAICRRLIVQEDLVVSAHSQMDVTAKTVCSNLKVIRDPEGSSWMTESGEAGYGHQVACSLVRNSLTAVLVLVMNELDYLVTWEREAVVGTLKSVNEVTAAEEVQAGTIHVLQNRPVGGGR